MVTSQLVSPQLTETQFDKLSNMVKDLCGIDLGEGKKELVKARLNKRLRALGLKNFDQYIKFIRKDGSGAELTTMLDQISTNLTSFFREMSHFKLLSDEILPRIVADSAATGRRLRVWSAGCSSGEEPYSLAVCAFENIPGLKQWDAKILATDLSTKVLAKAARGEYSADRVKTIQPQLRARYFDELGDRSNRIYRVKKHLREIISFGRLNLMDPWPMSGPFDVIFCRNVMIYFDKPTQSTLVNRYWELLRPGGMLFIGHSESLTGIKHRYRYVQPTVYQKP